MSKNVSTEESHECPLCMESLEMDDISFYPCSCGYQICRFCWHRIRTDESGLCPACRKPYTENPAEYTPLSFEQVQKMKIKKKQKTQEKKQRLLESRKNLADLRVVQKNLVFVIGLSPRLADPDILKRQEYFGKFGKILKVVINNHTVYSGQQGPSVGAYITYQRQEDSMRAIVAANNAFIDGRYLKASFGTTKYCTHFLRGAQCPKADCMYLHEMGEEDASFTKEDMAQGKHQVYEYNQLSAVVGTPALPKEQILQSDAPNTFPIGVKGSKRPNSGFNFIPEVGDPESALPASAQWAQKGDEPNHFSDPVKVKSNKSVVGTGKQGSKKYSSASEEQKSKKLIPSPNYHDGNAGVGNHGDSVPSQNKGDSLDIISEPNSSLSSSPSSSPQTHSQSRESVGSFLSSDPDTDCKAWEQELPSQGQTEEGLKGKGKDLVGKCEPQSLKYNSYHNNITVKQLEHATQFDDGNDMLSVLAGLDGPTGMTLGSLGTTWATPGLPQVKAESRASDQIQDPWPDSLVTPETDSFKIPSLSIKSQAANVAPGPSDVREMLSEMRLSEAEKKQRMASESYVNFGPTTLCEEKSSKDTEDEDLQEGLRAMLPGINVNFEGNRLQQLPNKVNLQRPSEGKQLHSPLPTCFLPVPPSMNIPQNTVSDTWGSSRQGEAVEAEDSEMLKQNRDSSDNWSKQTAIQSKASKPPPGFSTTHRDHTNKAALPSLVKPQAGAHIWRQMEKQPFLGSLAIQPSATGYVWPTAIQPLLPQSIVPTAGYMLPSTQFGSNVWTMPLMQSQTTKVANKIRNPEAQTTDDLQFKQVGDSASNVLYTDEITGQISKVPLLQEKSCISPSSALSPNSPNFRKKNNA